MNRILLALSRSCLACLLMCARAWAQATAQISGTARDQSGGVLPGVDITVTQTDTGITRTTVTNETGTYVLPNLPLGRYRLEAALQGFGTYTQTGITLEVNSRLTINPSLQVAQVAESVGLADIGNLHDRLRQPAHGPVRQRSRVERPPGGGDAAGVQRADQVLPNPYEDRSGRPGTRYLNPAAFALPALGTLGNIARNSIRGPRQWSLDMALSRIVPVGDAERLEFRVEAYNVLNSFRAMSPSVTLSDTNTFGVIREALDPRILQSALKYVC